MKQKNYYESPLVEVTEISIEMACMSNAVGAVSDYDVDDYTADWE